MRLRRLEPILRRTLGPGALPPGGTILVAVSGGADSTALLAGLAGLAPELGVRLHAAHLHHGLRGADADRDLEAVRQLCGRLGVPLTAARWDCRDRMRRLGLSGQAGLRTLRRRFLTAAARRAGALRIATAHTADDQIETVLMRLARGTGLPGLGGMSVRRGRWIKPLLAATRLEIERALATAGIAWREDASNRDPRYARTRVRLEVVPALARAMRPGPATGVADPRDRARLARRVAAASLEVRNARRLLERGAARILGRHGRIGSGEIRLDLTSWRSYPRPIRRAALRQSWRRLGIPAGLTTRHLDALQRLAGASGGGAALDLPCGMRAERDRGGLVIRRPGRDRVPSPVAIPARGRWTRGAVHGGWVEGPAAGRRMRARRAGEELFSADGLVGRLELRSGHPNEGFVPFGRRRARRLREFLNKQPVSRAVRARPMVLADAQGILWVVGVRRSARAPWRETTRRILWVHAEHP